MIKKIQKSFDSTESYISMALGLAVVLLAGLLIINYIRGQQPQNNATDNAKLAEQTEQKGDSTAPTPPAGLPTTHTVTAGDTLWSIATKYYNSGYNWVDIAKANNLSNPEVIENGQKLTIPSATPIVVKQVGQVSATSTDKKYTVAKGDNLWKIASAQYGNGYKWVDIARANNLVNPGLIHAGNILTLP